MLSLSFITEQGSKNSARPLCSYSLFCTPMQITSSAYQARQRNGNVRTQSTMPAGLKLTVLALFESLEGTWKLQRELGEQGNMQGIACFQPCGEGVLHYQEQGKATFNSNSFSSCREYAYVCKQGAIAVHFWDQKHRQPAGLLHKLHFHDAKAGIQALMAAGTHECANDLYKAHYLFINPQQFQLTYQVQGPRKDYTLTSYFSKVMAKSTLE